MFQETLFDIVRIMPVVAWWCQGHVLTSFVKLTLYTNQIMCFYLKKGTPRLPTMASLIESL